MASLLKNLNYFIIPTVILIVTMAVNAQTNKPKKVLRNKTQQQKATDNKRTPWVQAKYASSEKQVFSIYVAAKDKKAAKKTGNYIANYVEKKYKIPTMVFLDKLEKPKNKNAQAVVFFVNEKLFDVTPKNIKDKIKSAVVEFTGTFPKRVGADESSLAFEPE